MREDKVLNAFDFLINYYNCSFAFEENGGTYYIYQNETFKLKIYVWEQFDELDINLIYKDECFHIDPYVEDHSLITKRKGIKGHFFNYSREFRTIVSNIVKERIKEILK